MRGGLDKLAVWIAIFAAIVALAGCASTAETSGARQERTTVAIADNQKADIYKPAREGFLGFVSTSGDRKDPVVVYVHGGGWIKGDREKVYNLPAWAAANGYLLVSIDYAPVPRTTIDGQVAQVARAIAWVRDNISAYGGDPERIAIMGHSAGSHLVSMVAVKRAAGQIRGVVANDVQAYDLVAYNRMRKGMDRVYYKAFGRSRANWRKWSPITYVDDDSGYPPFLILYSGSNHQRRQALSNSFAEALRARGTRVALFDGKGYTHGTIASTIGKSRGVTSAIDKFLQSVFR